MAIRFDWNPVKAETNRRKHKVSFHDARAAFADPRGLDELDDREVYGEERFNLTGMAGNRLIVVTYTQRIDERTGEDIIRIIAARRAERREAKRYHEAQ
jgi:uncharacterized DUF497 family protein